jgi:hypothetical protein
MNPPFIFTNKTFYIPVTTYGLNSVPTKRSILDFIDFDTKSIVIPLGPDMEANIAMTKEESVKYQSLTKTIVIDLVKKKVYETIPPLDGFKLTKNVLIRDFTQPVSTTIVRSAITEVEIAMKTFFEIDNNVVKAIKDYRSLFGDFCTKYEVYDTIGIEKLLNIMG